MKSFRIILKAVTALFLILSASQISFAVEPFLNLSMPENLTVKSVSIGKIGEEETGLYYFRNRMYSPELGRFISTDPLDYVDGSNLYAYCNANYVNMVDPMGLEAVDEELKKYQNKQLKPGQLADLIGTMKGDPLRYSDSLNENELGYAKQYGTNLLNEKNLSDAQIAKAQGMFPDLGLNFAKQSFANFTNKTTLLKGAIKEDTYGMMADMYRMARDLNPLHFAFERGSEIGSGQEMFTGENVSRTRAGTELALAIAIGKCGEMLGQYASQQNVIANTSLTSDSSLFQSTRVANIAPYDSKFAAQQMRDYVITLYDQEIYNSVSQQNPLMLGAPGRPAWLSPADVAFSAESSSQLALESGLAQRLVDASHNRAPIYGTIVPRSGVSLSKPTGTEAGSNPHWFGNGHTNVRGPNFYILNKQVTEYVTTGGNPAPSGSMIGKYIPGKGWTIAKGNN